MKKSPLPETTWQRAVAFAARRHAGQCGPDGETPYVAHSVRVALTILSLFQCDDAEITAAALLHDVIEKTDTTYDEIAAEFGPRIAGMVGVLSRDNRLPAEEADKTYLAQLLAADWKTRLIKLADVYDHLTHAGDHAKRKKKAEQALTLATDTEPPIVLARRLLEAAIKPAR